MRKGKKYYTLKIDLFNMDIQTADNILNYSSLYI
jgi:hypothetical protein